MFKNLKEELFFIKETVRYGYGIGGALKYLKNKFFYAGKIFDKKIPECHTVDDFEIHMLCRKKDAAMLAWSLMSFINQTGICPRVVVHEDGSFDKKTILKLEHKFPGLEVLRLEKASQMIDNIPGLSEKLLEHRKRGHKLIYKLVDILLLSHAKKVMVLDSDVLFFKKPSEILEFINGKSPYEALISCHDGTYDLMTSEEYSRKHELLRKKTDEMNSGIILFQKNKITTDMMLEYFENTLRKPRDYFVEMTGWASLISQTNFNFLPIEKYIVKGKPEVNTMAKHFTSPRRHEFYIYGIDMVRGEMLKHE